MSLREKIENKKAVVGIIGLGYVGLPLADEFAKNGFRVLGFDLSKGKVEAVNRGESYIPDVPTANIAAHRRNGLIEATMDFDRLAEVDTVSICVPTPLSKTKDPDMSYVEAASRDVAKRVHEGMLVILESTTYPGTTDEVVLPMLEKSGLKVGKDFFLAFSPERVDPGNPKYGVKNTPKVVGGYTAECTAMAALLYSKCVDRVFPVTGTAAAEMVKLLENTFRSVNIGLVNEVAIMCEKLKLDVWEVIAAASTKPFGFMPFHPGPGLGGHCIPIDPLYLSWKLRALNYKARFIDLAAEVNTAMPDYVVELVAKALNERERSVKGSKVLVLGMAYKRDIDDARESPAIDVYRLLEARGAKVCYHDPFIPELHGDHGHGAFSAKSVPLTDDLLRSSDCVVIATDHSSFDIRHVVENAKLIVDSRNATGRLGKKFPNVVKL